MLADILLHPKGHVFSFADISQILVAAVVVIKGFQAYSSEQLFWHFDELVL